jgi:chromosome partitioning protein
VQTILVHLKGGSGKTTLATNIAGWLAGKRQRVGLWTPTKGRRRSGWRGVRRWAFPPVAGFDGDVGKMS